MKNTSIMSHFDTYNLVIMIDGEVTPHELFNHFLKKRDTLRAYVEYEKDDDGELTYKTITVVSDGGNYYNIDIDKFILLNSSHFLNIAW